MQVLANDIVRCFAFTLQAAPLYALAIIDRQHAIILKDERIQHCLQKHHQIRHVNKIYGDDQWRNEVHSLPNGTQTQVIIYTLSEETIRCLTRTQANGVVLSEAWYHTRFPHLRRRSVNDLPDGISYDAEGVRPSDDREAIKSVQLVLHKRGKWIASVVIDNDTCEAYKLAYQRIKAVQDLCE